VQFATGDLIAGESLAGSVSGDARVVNRDFFANAAPGVYRLEIDFADVTSLNYQFSQSPESNLTVQAGSSMIPDTVTYVSQNGNVGNLTQTTPNMRSANAEMINLSRRKRDEISAEAMPSSSDGDTTGVGGPFIPVDANGQPVENTDNEQESNQSITDDSRDEVIALSNDNVLLQIHPSLARLYGLTIQN
jgi:hypothetical protein